MLPTMKQQRLQSRLTNFQHSWLNKRSMSFCVTTEMWWPVYIEDKGLFCLLCKKHDMSNPQNKSKVFNKKPCKRFRPEEFQGHCCMWQVMNAVSAEMLQRVPVFQRTLDKRERVAEDVLLKVFTAAYWIMKEELPNHKIKSHVSPWAYMYSCLAADKKNPPTSVYVKWKPIILVSQNVVVFFNKDVIIIKPFLMNIALFWH